MAGPLFAALDHWPVRDLPQCLRKLTLGLTDHCVAGSVVALEHAIDGHHMEHQDAPLEAGQAGVTMDGTVYNLHHAVDLNRHTVGSPNEVNGSQPGHFGPRFWVMLVGIEVEHYGDDVLALPEMDLLVRMNNLDLNWRESLLSSPRYSAHPSIPTRRCLRHKIYRVLAKIGGVSFKSLWGSTCHRRHRIESGLKGNTPDLIWPPTNSHPKSSPPPSKDLNNRSSASTPKLPNSAKC